jgi:hypothetical protein
MLSSFNLILRKCTVKLKTIALVLSMLGLSAAAVAGSPGNNMVIPTGTDLIAPDSVGTWSFGIEALYMQSSDNFQYTAIGNPPLNNDFDNQTVGNSTNWGLSADIDYMFAGSSRDVNLSYTHLDFDNSASLDIPNGLVIIGNGGSGDGAPLANSASDSSEQDLNTANLTFGQLFHVGSRVDLHPFAGVQFTDFDDSQKVAFSAAVPDEFSLGINARLSSNFTGAGPRFGMDGAVHLGAGFSVVGTAAGALLVGEMDANLKPTVTANGITQQSRTSVDDYTAVIPELDAQLGLDYMYAFNPTVSMNAQVGYEAVNYFNIVDTDVLNITQVNSVNNTSDFNYHGPYFRLQLNVA